MCFWRLSRGEAGRYWRSHALYCAPELSPIKAGTPRLHDKRRRSDKPARNRHRGIR
ncbi:hypothetical protein SPHV1_2190040 [Novosphingobium sp. KN65.2]|nr:hypothetical protein SPHV1_2190040 [Novosphingobium sp. KN65.2]